jgi:hypothetical protein
VRHSPARSDRLREVSALQETGSRFLPVRSRPPRRQGKRSHLPRRHWPVRSYPPGASNIPLISYSNLKAAEKLGITTIRASRTPRSVSIGSYCPQASTPADLQRRYTSSAGASASICRSRRPTPCKLTSMHCRIVQGAHSVRSQSLIWSHGSSASSPTFSRTVFSLRFQSAVPRFASLARAVSLPSLPCQLCQMDIREGTARRGTYRVIEVNAIPFVRQHLIGACRIAVGVVCNCQASRRAGSAHMPLMAPCSGDRPMA